MKRAVISVSDKSGIVEFAAALAAKGYEIISTGGTASVLRQAGINVIEIEDVTGFPECFDGRVKTLHPLIHGGVLYLRDNAEHVATAEKYGMHSIDLICVNLYPFKKTVAKQDHSLAEAIENIDIGGPSLIRSGSKNYRFVTVVTDTEDYSSVIENMDSQGNVSAELRFKLSAKAFAHTAAYDAFIAEYLAKAAGTEKFPKQLTLTFEKKQELRYGENSHQQAAYYTKPDIDTSCITAAKFLHGKELSYNNIGDADGAVAIVKEFDKPVCVAVKHATPCAVSLGSDSCQAFIRAYNADPVSIYGGIIAFNTIVTEECAAEINKIFAEIVIAPSFTDTALAILAKKKNLRILELPEIAERVKSDTEFKFISNGLLVQDKDSGGGFSDKTCVTEVQPAPESVEDLEFAMLVCKHVKSNAIVIAKNGCTLGIGGGSVSRVWAAESAVLRAGEYTRGAVLASDAFFPFDDVVKLCAKAGISAIIQPGGSINDNVSIAACDEAGIAMVFTGIRHFKH